MPHAIVTGASSGIGEAIVAALLDQGWQVTGLSRSAVTRDSALFRSVQVDMTAFILQSSSTASRRWKPLR